MKPARLIRFVFPLVAVAALASAIHAGPIKTNRVAADAQWLAHIDMTGLVKSQFMQFVLDHGADADINIEGLDGIKQMFGVDVLTDIKDITIYGQGKPDAADGRFVAIVSATGAVDGLVEKLKEMGEAYSNVVVNGHMVHSFKADEDEIFFHFLKDQPADDRVIILGKNSVEVMRAITVVGGTTPNLAQQKHAVLSATPQPGTFLFVAADNIAALVASHHTDDSDDADDDDDEDNDDEEEDNDPASAVLKSAKSVVIEIGESGEFSFMQAALDTGKDETATNIADLLRGLVAMGKLAVNSEPTLAPLKSTLNSIELQTQGSNITVKARQNTATILNALKAIKDAEDAEEAAEADTDDAAPADKNNDEKDSREKDEKHSRSGGITVKIETKNPH